MTTQTFDEAADRQADVDYPVHGLGDAFFEWTTIEEADGFFFEGAHRHDFYELLWFTSVEANQFHDVDLVRYRINPNQVFLLLPGQLHGMDQRGKRGYLIAISKEFFEKQIGNDVFRSLGLSTNFNVVIPDSALHVLDTLMQLIRTEYNGARRAAILESYLRSWLLHCIELQKETQEIPGCDPRLRLLVGFIESHYRKHRRAEFYAKQLAISAKRLNALARESFGKTISQLLSDRLVLEAKREIGCMEKPIKEISYELGFSEPAYFTRFFGKQTGYAPQDFRKRMTALNN